MALRRTSATHTVTFPTCNAAPFSFLSSLTLDSRSHSNSSQTTVPLLVEVPAISWVPMSQQPEIRPVLDDHEDIAQLLQALKHVDSFEKPHEIHTEVYTDMDSFRNLEAAVGVFWRYFDLRAHLLSQVVF